jgi:hypothetical protein
MRNPIRWAAIMTLFAVVLNTSASADTIQTIAPLVAVRILTTNSDNYGNHHGFISVGDSEGGYAQYYWGGAVCPGLLLNDSQREHLQRGMGNPRILIETRTKLGQGSLCVVGFTFVLRSDLAGLP